MLQNRHDRVIEILFGICKAHRSYKEVYADHLRTPFKPIMIPSAEESGRPQSYKFRPDVWARLPSKKIDVLEVWDEQSEAGGVQDLILTALTPGLATLTIICFDQMSVDKAKGLARTVLSSVYSKNGEVLLSPDDVARRVILIPEGIQNDDTAIKEFLKDKLRSFWISKSA